MTISFYGEGCFRLQTGDFSVLTDPIEASSGLSSPRFKFDAVVKTLTQLPLSFLKSEALQIIGPGEYDFGESRFKGFVVEKESGEKFLKTVYVAEMEGIRFGFLGHLSETLAPNVLENFEDIDVLMAPVGGKPFIEQKQLVKFIRQIGPKLIVPSFYKIPGLKRKADDLKVFSEALDHPKIEPQEKLVIKKKDLSGLKPNQLAVLKV